LNAYLFLLEYTFSFLCQILGTQSDSDENSSVWEIGVQIGLDAGVLKKLAACICRLLQEQGLDYSGDEGSTGSTLIMDTANSSENPVTIH